ncbi:MAG: hypothetical protein Q9160_006073 [Pyrenula sp. 1 TL-2023]
MARVRQQRGRSSSKLSNSSGESEGSLEHPPASFNDWSIAGDVRKRHQAKDESTQLSKLTTPKKDEKHGYEFFGPPGAFGITFGLPILVYLTVFLCNDVSGCPNPSVLQPKSLTLAKLKKETPWPENGFTGLFDLKVLGWVLAYYGTSLSLQLLLPGTELDGTELRCGGRHHYKFNAFSSACIILAGAGVSTFIYGAENPLWTFIWDNLVQIVTANIVIATIVAVYVYLASFSVPHGSAPNPTHRELAQGGHSGNMLYDFFIGRELNPQIHISRSLPLIGGQTIDIKTFFEVRPGLLGWLLLDLAFCAHQYSAHGYLSDSIIFLTGFQALYVLDAIYMEPAIMTQIDITTDGFGFMLAFGDLVWLPFIYSLQARYLAVYPVNLGYAGIAGVLAVQAFGYWLFRTANNQKDRFRTNPNDPRVKHFTYIQTKTGSRLLTSGMWGTARHINYLGDWIMAWSYSLPTGFAGYLIHNYTNPVTGATTKEVVQGEARGWGVIATYFYVLYFGVLLVHREQRDEAKCARKYGADWEEYKRKVKWRIVPYVY